MASSVIPATSDQCTSHPVRHIPYSNRIIGAISRTFFDRFPHRARHGLNKGQMLCSGLGWLPFGPESIETKFLRTLKPTGVVWDIGAFRGHITLHFARTASRVVAFEPCDRNYDHLRRNVALNGLMDKVTCYPHAVGEAVGRVLMAYDAKTPGTSRIAESSEYGVYMTTVDELCSRVGARPPSLLKIDTEGHELAVLHGAAATISACRPDLYIENHGDTLAEKQANVRNIVAFLDQFGYQVMHVETGMAVRMRNYSVASEGHLHCTAR